MPSAPVQRLKDAESEREEEADTFASFLLMPFDGYRNQIGGQEMTRDLLGHVTDRFGVSLLAATRKWIEFTNTRAAMVVARDGFALWGRASTSACKSGVFIRQAPAWFALRPKRERDRSTASTCPA